MAQKFEITEYYELLALHKAVHVARFARNPLNPFLSGSPYLADIAKRIVYTLAQMEIERGKPDRANDWQIKIDESGEIWQIAIKNASIEPDFWNQQTQEQKFKLACIILSPFVFTDEMIEVFIHQVNEQTKK